VGSLNHSEPQGSINGEGTHYIPHNKKFKNVKSVYILKCTHTHIWVSIWEYFHSQFSTSGIIHIGKVKRVILEMRNPMWLILMSLFIEVIPSCWATRNAQTISQNLRVLCLDWLHLCTSTHCQ